MPRVQVNEAGSPAPRRVPLTIDARGLGGAGLGTSVPEVVGSAALVLDPDRPEAWVAAVERVLSDRNLRAELSLRGRKRAEEFSWERPAPAWPTSSMPHRALTIPCSRNNLRILSTSRLRPVRQPRVCPIKEVE